MCECGSWRVSVKDPCVSVNACVPMPCVAVCGCVWQWVGSGSGGSGLADSSKGSDGSGGSMSFARMLNTSGGARFLIIFYNYL